MSSLVKILIGTAVVAGVSAIVAVASSKDKEEQKAEKVEDGKVVQMPANKEDKSVLERIKEYAWKKVVKILAFVALNADKIEAVSTIIGLGSGVIAIAGSIRDFRQGNDTQKKLDEINEKLDTLKMYHQLENQVSNHNNEVFGVALEHISNAVNVNTEEMKRDLDAIYERDKNKLNRFRTA